MPILQQVETAGIRAMQRDPAFPDVEQSDVMDLFHGDLSDIRGHLQGLFTHLANHQDIDVDLWRDLRDFAQRAMQELEDVACVRCLELNRVRAARPSGLDERLCDEHERMVWAR